MKHYRKQECHWRRYRRSGRVKNINPGIHYHSVIRKNPITTDPEGVKKWWKKMFLDRPLKKDETPKIPKVGEKKVLGDLYKEDLEAIKSLEQSVGKSITAGIVKHTSELRAAGFSKEKALAIAKSQVRVAEETTKQEEIKQKGALDILGKHQILDLEQNQFKLALQDLRNKGEIAKYEPAERLSVLGETQAAFLRAEHELADLEKRERSLPGFEKYIKDQFSKGRITEAVRDRGLKNIEDERLELPKILKKAKGNLMRTKEEIGIRELAQKAGREEQKKMAWPYRKERFLDRITDHASDVVGEVGGKIIKAAVADPIIDRISNKRLYKNMRDQAVTSARANAAYTRYLYKHRALSRAEALDSLRNVKATLRANLIAATKGVRLAEK